MSQWKKVAPNQTTKWVNPFGTLIKDQIASQLTIPPFVQAAIDYIVATGLKEEGIFRISANLSSVNKLKALVASGSKKTFKKPDVPYDVACLLKLYFRELLDPVCTFEFYDCFIATQGIPEEYRVAALAKVIGLLPLPNQLTLMKLVEFCAKIVEYKEINKMGFDNLAVCFAPNLIRAKSVSMELVLSDAGRANNAIRLMFTNLETVFQRTRMRLERMQIGNKEEKLKIEEQKRRSQISDGDPENDSFYQEQEISYQENNQNYQQETGYQENNNYQENGNYNYQENSYDYQNNNYQENGNYQEYQNDTNEYVYDSNQNGENAEYQYESAPTPENWQSVPPITDKSQDSTNDAQEESPSLILAHVDPRLVAMLSEEKQALDNPGQRNSEEDQSNAQEFTSTLKNRYTMFVKNNMKKLKKDKTRSMALGQLDAYEKQITKEYCQAVVGVEPNDLKEGTWESSEYEKLYSKTIANLKNFSSSTENVE